MRKYSQFKFLSIVLLFILIFSNAASGFSFNFPFLNLFHKDKPTKTRIVSSKPASSSLQPTRIKVGIYVLNIGKYNLQSSSYLMDYYLIFKCKPICKNMNFEIMNATGGASRLVDTQGDMLTYRVQSELSKTDSLRDYPFDNHKLDIVVEDKQMTSDQMIFEVDPSITALDSNLHVVGFYLLPNWAAEVTNHYYSVYKRTFSSYQFSVMIQRPWIAGILKCILPAFIIICCNFLALFMKIDRTSQRLSIATSTLIASIVFHLNITSSIPPLGYITYADMFMFINYLFLLGVLIEVVITTYFLETKHQGLAAKINTLCACVFPIIWLLLQIINLRQHQIFLFST